MRLSEAAGWKEIRQQDRRAKKAEQARIMDVWAQGRAGIIAQDKAAREAAINRKVDQALGEYRDKNVDGLLVHPSRVLVDRKGRPTSYNRMTMKISAIEDALREFRPVRTKNLTVVPVQRALIPKGWQDIRALEYCAKVLREKGMSNFTVQIV